MLLINNNTQHIRENLLKEQIRQFLGCRQDNITPINCVVAFLKWSRKEQNSLFSGNCLLTISRKPANACAMF